MNAAPNAIVTLDTAGRIRAYNAAAVAMFEHRECEALGEPITFLVSSPVPGDDRSLRNDFESLTRISSPGDPIEMMGKSKDGVVFPVAVRLGAARVNNEQVFVAITEDTRKQKTSEHALRQAETQLQQAQKMDAVGRLAGGVAHDFNNLLTAITGYAEFAREGVPANHPAREDISEALAAADRATGLTRQLLLFSRQQPAEARPISVREHLGELQKLLKTTVGESIQLALEVADEDLLVLADPTQIDQVLINLSVNARDAMPDGGKLSIRAETGERRGEYGGPLPQGKYIQIRVTARVSE